MTYSKEIPLNGLSTSPSDYASGDGDLGAAIGVVHKDGSLFNGYSPDVIFKSYSEEEGVLTGKFNQQALYIHENSGYCNYIVKFSKYSSGESTETIGWISSERLQTEGIGGVEELLDGNSSVFDDIDVRNIISVGNMLIISSDDKQFYFRFDNESYVFLGNKLPNLPIRFELFGPKVKNGQYEPVRGCVELDPHGVAERLEDYSPDDDNRILITNAITGGINKSLSKAAEDNLFAMPFLICASFVLYDESDIMATTPKLLVTNSERPLIKVFKDPSEDKVITKIYYGTSAGTTGVVERQFDVAFPIMFVDDEEFKERVYKWNDIIRGVRIFVSAPLYTYKQGDNIKSFSKGSKLEVGRTSLNSTTYTITANAVYADIPSYDNKSSAKNIEQCSNFYLYKEYSLNEFFDIIESESTEIDFEKSGVEYKSTHSHRIQADSSVLKSIVNQSRLKEDFLAQDTIIPSSVVSYNGRLNYMKTSRILGSDFDLGQCVSFTRQITSVIDTSQQIEIQMVLSVSKNSKNINIKSKPYNTYRDSISDLHYILYKDPDVKEIRIYNNTDGTYCKISPTEHDGLNASVFVNSDFNLSYSEEGTIDELVFDEHVVQENNLIYTSEVNNPFVFYAENVEQISNGTIIAMMPASMALSQGQFGQFPMYAFTTEGVWALSVSDTGGWESKQPISRDVAISADMILQLDQQVLFATDRGLMLISGSNIECITEIFDGHKDNMIESFKDHFTAVLSDYSDIQYEGAPPFREFIRDGNMHYDYKNQRIIIGNKKYRFCYIFNIKDKMWTSEQLQLDSSLNSYPEALAVASFEGKKLLINLSEKDAVAQITPTDGFILTRPLKLDSPDQLKTIRTVVVRGEFNTNQIGPTPANVDIILYASRDLSSWNIIGSTRGDRLTLHHGTPYKYFRVGIISHLEDGESINGLTIEYELKQTNRVR